MLLMMGDKILNDIYIMQVARQRTSPTIYQLAKLIFVACREGLMIRD
jgi:hypothetical protein